MTMRVAIYARVSTDEQEPENQLRQLRAWCQAASHEIVGEYIDRGVSGRSRRRGATGLPRCSRMRKAAV